MTDRFPAPLNFGDWPGRIVFGRGAIERLAEVVSGVGGTRALVICGSTVERTGLLAKVTAALGDRLAAVFTEAKPHTPVEMVERGLAVFKDSKADALVTIGGGSAIDAGKAIQIRLATGGDLRPYAISYAPGGTMKKRPLPRRTVPHVAVPTTAGSASDVMPTAAARDPQSRVKILFWDDDLTPSATVLDPEMAVYASPALTAATGMTAMARSIECLYSRYRHPISTGLALHAARLLHDALPRAVAEPHDLDARAACMMACTMSGMASINAMVSVVHAIGHIVGGRYALQHGISHSILLAPGMKRLLPTIGADQHLLCSALGGSPGQDCADLISAFVAGLPLPRRLRDVGVGEAELAEIAHLTMSDYMMANLPRDMTEGEVLGLLRSVW